MFLHLGHSLVKAVLERVHCFAMMLFLKFSGPFTGILPVSEYAFELLSFGSYLFVSNSFLRFKPFISQSLLRLQPLYSVGGVLCLRLKPAPSPVQSDQIPDSYPHQPNQYPDNYLHNNLYSNSIPRISSIVTPFRECLDLTSIHPKRIF